MLRCTIASLIVALVVAMPAWAQVTWIADGTNGYDVSTAANWDTGNVPTTGDAVYIANGTTALIGAGNTFAGDIGAWYLGNGTGTSGNVTQTGGDVTATDWFRLGFNTGTAAGDPECLYDMSGGTASVGVLTVVGLGGKGKLKLSGGDASNPGAAFSGGNRLYVGDTHGTGVVEMSGYSSLAMPYVTIGRNATDNIGTVTMTGHANLSAIIPTNSSGDDYIGTSAGTGSLSMTDDTTATITANSLFVGDGGNGSITLGGNAVLTTNCMQRWTTDEEPVGREDSYTYIGNGAGAVATLTMSGHSTMTSNNDNSNAWRGQFWVGRAYSTGTIDLSGGTGYDEATRGAKLVVNHMSDIGSYGNATDRGVGNLNVHEYAQFESAGLVMGDGGTGNLLIDGHGQVTVTGNQWMRLGFFSTGIFNGTIEDSGSLLTTGDMLLGDNVGTATMTMKDNASLHTNGSLYLGNDRASATLTLTAPTIAGDAITVQVDNRLYIGDNGTDTDTADATLYINEGTSVNVNSSTYLGYGDNANGTVIMNGGSLNAVGSIFVGRTGGGANGSTGILTMNGDSSTHTNGILYVGNSYGGGSGTVTLNDNAQISSGSSICVAWGGMGVLNVGDGTEPGVGETGAVATSGSYVRLGDGNAAAEATLNLNVGGTLETAYIDSLQGASATVNFDGGILKALGSDIPEDPGVSDAIMFLSNTGTVTSFELNVMAGGAIIDTNGFTDTITEALLSGEAEDGGLTKLGAGELILAGTANTYLGETVVAAGTLTTTSNAMFSDTADLSIASGADVNLDFIGEADMVFALYLDGVMQASGTWGATGSGALYTNDTYFSGTGTVMVAVPEPSLMVLLVGLAMALAGCRIRR